MSDLLQEFLVAIGYKVDAASQAQAAASMAGTEDKLNKTVEAGAKKRASISESLAKLVVILEQRSSEARDKTLKAQDEKEDKRASAAEKKANERRDKSVREFQVAAVKVAAIASKVTIGIETLTAGGVLYAVDRAAKGFENLFYQAQNIGGTEQGISALKYAISQLGGTAEGAQSSLNAFGERLHNQRDATLNYLQSLGVQTRDANGQVLAAEQLYTNLLKTMSTKPQLYAQSVLANMGTDEQTRMAAARPELQGKIDEYNSDSTNIGVDRHAAGLAGVSWEQSFRHLVSVIDDIGTRLQTSLITSLQPTLNSLTENLAKNGGAIADFVTKVAKGVTDIVDAFVHIPEVQAAVNGISGHLETFAKYVRSDDFTKDIKGFVDDVSALAHSIREALEWLGVIPSGKSGTRTGSIDGFSAVQQGELPFMRAAYRGRGSLSDETNARSREKLGRFDGTHVSPNGRAGGIANNPNATKENAQSIIDTAKEIGTTPEDLATVIGYESAGSYSPSKWGGAGGNYMGLIQFGSSERQKYGADQNQTFPDQMKAVGRYLKDRGYKPGMGLMDLYSTINAGSPGHYNASDGNGTVADHVSRMQGKTAEVARAFVQLAQPAPAPAPVPAPVPAPAPAAPSLPAAPTTAPVPPSSNYDSSKGAPLTSDYIDNKKTGYMSDASMARYQRDRAAWLAKQHAATSPQVHPAVAAMTDWSKVDADVRGRASHHQRSILDAAKATIDRLNHATPFGQPAGFQHQVNNSRGDTNITHSPTFNITGGDPRQNIEAARLTASRGQQDLLRNMQGALA